MQIMTGCTHQFADDKKKKKMNVSWMKKQKWNFVRIRQSWGGGHEREREEEKKETHANMHNKSKHILVETGLA